MGQKKDFISLCNIELPLGRGEVQKKKYNEEANESDKLALPRETSAIERNLITLRCGCVMTLTIINQFGFGIKPLNYSLNIAILWARKRFHFIVNIEFPKLVC